MVTLDTCIIVWLSLAPDKLTKKAHNAIKKNSLLISDISLWEIAMLLKAGRIIIEIDYIEYINLIIHSFALQIQSITPEIARIAVDFADNINRDPADRIIAATSLLKKAPLVTADNNLIKAKVIDTIW